MIPFEPLATVTSHLLPVGPTSGGCRYTRKVTRTTFLNCYFPSRCYFVPAGEVGAANLQLVSYFPAFMQCVCMFVCLWYSLFFLLYMLGVCGLFVLGLHMVI